MFFTVYEIYKIELCCSKNTTSAEDDDIPNPFARGDSEVHKKNPNSSISYIQFSRAIGRERGSKLEGVGGEVDSKGLNYGRETREAFA